MIAFKFPDIGEGITEGLLIKWLVKEGDRVKEGDLLFEVETDKVTTEIPSPATGIIKSLKGQEGDTIYVGDVIVEILEHEEENTGQKTENLINNDRVEEENAGVVGALEVSDEVMESSQEGRNIITADKTNKVLATPVARKMAHDLGLNINTIEGTGPQGRVMKMDIQRSYEAKNKSSQETRVFNIESNKEERVKLSSLRKTIARKMTQSMYTAPHAVLMDEVDVTDLVQYREKIKDIFIHGKNIKLTYLPFIMKALVMTLKEVPNFNGQLDEEKEEYIIKKYYHIGMAVDTDDGLLVPVINNVEQKGIITIMEDINRLSQGARDRTLKLEELKGSTFTVTNFGSLGVKTGMPIINYPEVAILGIGQIYKKPVVIDDKVVVRSILPLALSIDHRVLDGGDGGRFLNIFKKYIKDPDYLLLS